VVDGLGTDASLVCIGNLTIDETVHGNVRSVPAMGGDAAYAALAARLFLADVTMLAPIGNDLSPALIESLHNAGVRAENLPTRDLPTVRNIVTYHADGSRTWEMLSTEKEFDALSVYPDDVPASALASDGIVLSAMSLDSQLALTPWLREHTGAALYLDLQEDYLDGNRDALFGIIAASHVFMPSEIEATSLARTDDLVAAGRVFQALGPRTVVIKRAELGSLVLDGDTVTEIPADRVKALDSTGAGDAYCGAFAAVHLATGDAIEAARAGSRAARIAIGDFGIAALARAAHALHHGDSGETTVGSAVHE
jgi:sugar/nucleoside kinase (ribokinase family)